MFIFTGFSKDESTSDFMHIGVSTFCIVQAIFTWPKMMKKNEKIRNSNETKNEKT